MDPLLIDADDKHRASQEEAGSGDFGRMLRLCKPHWRFIAMGLVASLIYGMLHSISIVAMMPVLKVVLSEEGFEGWVQRVVVQDRIDAYLALDLADDQGTESASLELLIVKVRSESDLAAAGVTEGSAIVTVDGQGGPPLELLTVLAEAVLLRQPLSGWLAVGSAVLLAGIVLATRRPTASNRPATRSHGLSAR